MFGNFKLADFIAYKCSVIDNKCRKELEREILVSERDYVTALTTRIRDELSAKLKLKCHTQTIRPREENENGVDGIIVFKFDNEIKAGLFEAKRPQVTKVNNRWDYLSTRNISHFSEQIEKQRIWKGQLAIWEMFLNEGHDGFECPPYEAFGSSCVWHDNAYDFMHQEKLIYTKWTTHNLKELLFQNGINFYSIIFDIVSCRAGKKHTINTKDQTFTIVNETNDNASLRIPIPVSDNEEIDKRIDSFLLDNRLDSYMFIDLTSSASQ